MAGLVDGSMVWGCITCCVCETLSDHWVVWGASHVEAAYYFCSNDCLAVWLREHPTVEWPAYPPLDPT
jgi:hypothetical protein